MPRGAVKGEPDKLLGIKPIGAALRRVLALRQRAGQRFGFEIIAEAGHVVKCGHGSSSWINLVAIVTIYFVTINGKTGILVR